MEKRIKVEGIDFLKFSGIGEENITLLRNYFKGKLVIRGDEIYLSGEKEEVENFEVVINTLVDFVKNGQMLKQEDIKRVLQKYDTQLVFKEQLEIITPKKKIIPRTPNQEIYLRAIIDNHIVVGIGPAGTGKTYLAVAMAIKYLLEKQVEKIVLTRPAVEAGESLGFLPGDYQEKINPYLTPLYDALYSMMPAEKIKKLMETRVIEVAPLAYMRGRTIQDAFLILDEAQNTRSVQMKMFLTRIGPRTKVVITGDITQIDLPREETSGLLEIQKILQGIEGIKFIYFTKEDVVRHDLVRKIVEAYEKLAKSTDKTP